MKPQCLVSIAMLLSFGNLFGQNHQLSDQASLLTALFKPDSLTNMAIIIHHDCPSQYTNVISNPNLFTPEQQELLLEIPSKYKNVTTNSGPPGSVLTGLDETNGCWVAHFNYTNSDAYEDISFGNRSAEARHNGGYDDFIANLGPPLARFRIKDGNGYDVTIDRSSGKFLTFAQIHRDKPNGLFVMVQNDHCETLLHLVNGKAVGTWLEWDTYTNNHLIEVRIKTSLDYFKYMTQQVQM